MLPGGMLLQRRIIVMNIFFALIMSLALLYESCAHALIVGSNNAVSIVTTCTIFPAADSNNTILGFTWLKNGYTLEDATTSCTFDALYPISGTINLNGGTLYLQNDMVLANPVQIESLGTIIGNGHSLEFCESVTYLPANLKTIKDLSVFFDGDIELQGGLTVQGHCLINCTGNTITIGNSVGIEIDEKSTLEVQDAILKNVNNNIECTADTSHLIIQNVIACLAGDSHFTHGDITIQNSCKLTGPYTFWYDSNNPCLIDFEASMYLDGGMTLKCGKKAVDGVDPISFYDSSSKVISGECTLHITSTGIALTRGRLEIIKNIVIESDATCTTYGIVLGDGISAANDFSVYLGGGSMTTFNGPLTYNNMQPGLFYSAGPSAAFVRKLNSPFYLAKTCLHPTSSVIFEVINNQYAPTTLSDNSELYYNNMYMNIPGLNQVTYYAKRTNTYSCLLNGSQFLYLTSGIFQDPLWIHGTGNVISGNGTITGTITLLDSNTQLFFNLAGIVRSTISLNGGSLTLYDDISMSCAPCFVTSGTINLDTFTLSFDYAENTEPASNEFQCPMVLTGNNGFIRMGDNTTLTTTWTIQGIVTIDGNGYALDLANAGKIVIDKGAHLTLRNMRLNLIGAGDIICADNTSIITLDSIHWVQNDNFVFDTGAIFFRDTVKMSGPGFIFTYQSTQTSTISYDSSLQLDYDFTLSYAPSNGSETLLRFYDFTSQLELNYATLYIDPGMQLLNGQLLVTGNSSIYAGEKGVTIGDQTGINDMRIIFNGEPALTIEQGILNYKNINASSLQMNTSRININSNVTINIFENMDLDDGSIYFNVGSTYAHAENKAITSTLFGWYTEKILS